MFTGCGTAIVTPFRRDGQVDEETLRALVDRQEEGGVDAIVPCGTTGESATLGFEEHVRVIEIVADQVSRAKVIAGTGSNATHEAVELSRAAEDIGVDYLLSITPYYNKPTRKGVLEHFRTLTGEVDTPIIVYNVPGRTGLNLSSSATVELANMEGVVGIKEASGDMVQVMEILRDAPEDFAVLSGEDVVTFPILALGGRGVISVASNLVPGLMADMVHRALDGDLRGSGEIHYRLLRLFRHLFLETNPIPVKTALGMMGFPVGPFRLPLCEMEEENIEVLRGTLSELELIQE
ncbi:MAG: 4-hydroxy-tetrahydrodipicolinate synthase [Methanomassiliicoccales archaeon]